MDAPLAPSPLHLYWAKVANVNATTKEEALIKQQFTTIGIELGKRSFSSTARGLTGPCVPGESEP